MRRYSATSSAARRYHCREKSFHTSRVTTKRKQGATQGNGREAARSRCPRLCGPKASTRHDHSSEMHRLTALAGTTAVIRPAGRRVTVSACKARWRLFEQPPNVDIVAVSLRERHLSHPIFPCPTPTSPSRTDPALSPPKHHVLGPPQGTVPL